jgi:hypothetical protein
MAYVIAALTCGKGACRIDFAAHRGHEMMMQAYSNIMNSTAHV